MAFMKRKPLGSVGEFFLSLVFIAAGLAVIYFMASDNILICNRAEDKVELQEKNIFRGTQITAAMKMGDFQGAEVTEGKDSKGNPIYHVMLVTNQIRLPFATGRFSSCNKTVSRINQYLQSTENDLKVTESGTILLLLGSLFTAVGVFVLLQSLARLFKRMLVLFLPQR